jgi:hypothetical protein
LRRAALLIGVLLTIWLLRLALFPPSLIHANFHGISILDSVLDPSAPRQRAEYGPVSFVVLGVAAQLFGATLDTVAAVNQFFAVLTLGVLGILAARWSGASLALWGTLACGALNPLFSRTGASEDAHVLAVLLAALGLLCLDLAAERGAHLWLALGAGALVLAVYTRQTIYLWPPIAFGVAIARSPRRVLRWPAFWPAASLVAAALVVRVLSAQHAGADMVSISALPRFYARPAMIVSLLAWHPFFDVARFAAAYLPLGLFGAVVLLRRGALGAAWLTGSAAYFLLTLPFGWASPGIELAFRLPAAALAFIAVGAGAGVLLQRPVTAGLVALAALAPGALSGWDEARRVSPSAQEWRWLERQAAALPKRVAIVDASLRDPQPSYRLARGPFRRHGVEVSLVREADGMAEPLYFVEGVGCRAFSLVELMDPAVRALPDDAAMDWLFDHAMPALARHEAPPGLLPIPAVRPECAAALNVPTAGEEVVIDAAPGEWPFVAYGASPVPLRLHRLR